MAKRPASEAFELDDNKGKVQKKEGKKHSLDSDEEDSGAEEERNNVMNADDIEGEEDGIGGMEGEVSKILVNTLQLISCCHRFALASIGFIAIILFDIPRSFF